MIQGYFTCEDCIHYKDKKCEYGWTIEENHDAYDCLRFEDDEIQLLEFLCRKAIWLTKEGQSMRDASNSAEEYRDWMMNILHENDADELISLLVPFGEEKLLKMEIDIYKSHRNNG